MYDVPAGIALLILSVVMIAGGMIANVRHEIQAAKRRHPSARTSTPVAPVPDDESDRYRRYHSSNQHGR